MKKESRKSFIKKQNELLLMNIKQIPIKPYSMILKFGKYKGMKLSEVKIIDASYVSFLASDRFVPKTTYALDIQIESTRLTIN